MDTLQTVETQYTYGKVILSPSIFIHSDFVIYFIFNYFPTLKSPFHADIQEREGVLLPGRFRREAIELDAAREPGLPGLQAEPGRMSGEGGHLLLHGEGHPAQQRTSSLVLQGIRSADAS